MQQLADTLVLQEKLKFMLARLISADQVVLLCGSNNIYLFYQGRVYMRLTQFSIGSLPERREKYCPNGR